MWLLSALLLCLPLVAGGQSAMDQGVQAYRSGHYKEAVEALKKAVAQNPSNVEAHLGLAAAYGSQYVPGSTDEGSRDNLRHALAEYQTVLQLDPSNKVALESLGQLAYNESITTDRSKLDEAAEWYRKLASVDASNEQAHYFLGIIAWSKSYISVAQARQKLGIPADAQGPLSDEATRQSLAGQYDSIIAEGIENLREALAIKADDEDAMSYLSLSLRVRAALDSSAEDSAKDVAEAERWSQLSLETRRQKRGPPSERGAPNLATIPPPPPPGPAGEIPEISATAAEANLESKAEAIYPPLALSARVQGEVVFRITIGDDGRVKHMMLEHGHPLLVKAAKEAVLQYVYRPVLLDGHPTAVRTTVAVGFSLP
jgi:hypothetical protein